MTESPNSDAQIAACLTFGRQKSFMLKAAAGSGKTGALVSAVQHALEVNSVALKMSGAKIAVITYTRAARDEVQKRLSYDPRVSVSTIHSFAWKMIQPHTDAIRVVRESMLESQIDNLTDLESRGRAGAASEERLRKIAKKTKLLEQLPEIRHFLYSPDNDVPTNGELGHSEVIDLFSELLKTKPLLADILVGTYPIVFIDEVQDTAKSIILPLMDVEAGHQNKFTLGLFGDMMQRIYLDGVPNLPSLIPSRWASPRISVNHRSGKRIVDLANAIRVPVDGESQSVKHQRHGFVRLFLADICSDRLQVEKTVRERMANVTADELWNVDKASDGLGSIKVLVLEHTLAASRLGFQEFSDCFADKGQKEIIYGQGARADSRTNYLGRVTELFSAIQTDDLWKADVLLASLRADSTGFTSSKGQLQAVERASPDVNQARLAARELMKRVQNVSGSSLLDLLSYIRTNGLFTFPEAVDAILPLKSLERENGPSSQSKKSDPSSEAWLGALRLDWTQFHKYHSYIMGRSAIDTHQGVKGLEFDRVMLVLDDSQAKGNWFSYGKLLGTEELSLTDKKNQSANNETSVDRTRRLFYVSCTRAIESLAIVHYVADIRNVSITSELSPLFHTQEVELVS